MGFNAVKRRRGNRLRSSLRLVNSSIPLGGDRVPQCAVWLFGNARRNVICVRRPVQHTTRSSLHSLPKRGRCRGASLTLASRFAALSW